MTNEFSVGWAKVRDRDVLGGFVIFVFANLLLLGLVVLGSDVLGHDGSHDAKVAFGIITVALNLMLWLWNDGAIADTEASTKDISGADSETEIAKQFLKAPWKMYRGLILIISIAVTASLLYSVYW